jgi:MSHA biogenesis protein MshN
MSVINKMLRDLDKRQSPTTAAADPLRRDINSVGALTLVRRPSPAMRWATGLLPVAAAVAGAYVWWSFQHAPPAEPLVMAAPRMAPAPRAAPDVVPAPMVVAPAEALVAPAPVVVRPEPTMPPSPPVVAQKATSTSSPAAIVTPVTKAEAPQKPVSVAQPILDTPTPTPTPAPAPAPARAATQQPEAPAASNRQQQAAREALAQSQALWASGARDSAIQTLQDALVAAESGGRGITGASETLAPLVRELARMELAEGRPAAVWEMLVRLEPMLANQPELWAMRANAAQRLGRHQDSVLGYTTALEARPSEQRWLLGAAVSLAALGQTASAAEMAEKARAVGPVSREILAYLRQQGVPLTDRP